MNMNYGAEAAMRRRVLITGVGAVTPVGIGVPAYWESLLAGRSGVGPITLFDASDFPVRIAAEVKDFDPTRWMDRKQARLLARGAQFGVSAAVMALEDAGWPQRPGDGRTAVLAGISNSAQDAVEAAVDTLREHGLRRVLPYTLTKCFPHSTATEAGRLTGFQDQVLSFSTGCTSGFNAVLYAFNEIRAGRLDAVLVTATDSTLSRYVFGVFCKAGGMLSENQGDPATVSRPFDLRRDGGVLGEGAGALLLESADHARRREARPLAEVLGVATGGTGYSCQESPEKSLVDGMATTMAAALAGANVSPRGLDYVGAHGVSDPHLDAWETNALKRVLGAEARRIPISSVKSMIGIPQNAAAMLQLIATLMAMRDSILPPTINYEYPDPQCDLDWVPNHPRRNRVERAMVFTHGFNGSDAAVVIGRAPPA